MGGGRRKFLQGLTALSAIGFSGALPRHARADSDNRIDGDAIPTTQPELTRALPRVRLMVGLGTLPSVGQNRMDLLRYRFSGVPRLTGEQLIESLPELAGIAEVSVDNGGPYASASHDDLRKL